MNKAVITNEWLDVDEYPRWRFRTVVVRFSDGNYGIAMWSGVAWVNPKTFAPVEHKRIVTHFYIFERFIDKTNYQNKHYEQ